MIIVQGQNYFSKEKLMIIKTHKTGVVTSTRTQKLMKKIILLLAKIIIERSFIIIKLFQKLLFWFLFIKSFLYFIKLYFTKKQINS